MHSRKESGPSGYHPFATLARKDQSRSPVAPLTWHRAVQLETSTDRADNSLNGVNVKHAEGPFPPFHSSRENDSAQNLDSSQTFPTPPPTICEPRKRRRNVLSHAQLPTRAVTVTVRDPRWHWGASILGFLCSLHLQCCFLL